LWNCDTTPFIQVTCAGVELPIRHTVSWAGTEPDEDVVPLLDPHPAARAVRAEAARMAAAAFLFLTLLSPFGSCWHSVLIWGRWAAAGASIAWSSARLPDRFTEQVPGMR
jgi:hypothetical protein